MVLPTKAATLPATFVAVVAIAAVAGFAADATVGLGVGRGAVVFRVFFTPRVGGEAGWRLVTCPPGDGRAASADGTRAARCIETTSDAARLSRT